MALIGLLALLGVMVGIIGLDLSANRFAFTDLRELYVFAAPIALLLGGLVAGLGRRIGWILLCGLLAIWLLIDFQMYVGTQCQSCPPRSDWKVADLRLQTGAPAYWPKQLSLPLYVEAA
jgi:hypothetical protein